MTDEPEKQEQPPEEEQEQEQEEQQEEKDERPTHAGCGGKLTPGMKYCPACGEAVNTDAYKD